MAIELLDTLLAELRTLVTLAVVGILAGQLVDGELHIRRTLASRA
jgi:hypothetical protein